VLLGCGLCAGILGGAYGMNGPPLVVYGSLRRWSPAELRSTLQAYFLPASLIGRGGYWVAGLWSPAVTRYSFISLAGTLVATALGRVASRRLDPASFFAWVYGALVLIGLALLRQAPS
jgi:uncharacterized membrane protein YfcA